MKIDVMQAGAALLVPEHELGVKTERKTKDFSTELMHSEEGLSTERLKELLDQIDDHGAKLTETPTYVELRDYRELIKEFLSEAVSRMYVLDTQSGWDRRGRQKAYTTVRKVDRVLSQIAEEIRTGQANALSIIEKHGEIRGLLVDLFM